MIENILYEEEMIRLAEEMSLQERREQENYEYKWDASNLDAVRTKLRIYEEILDSIDYSTPEFHNESTNHQADSSLALSDEELREIFYSAGVSEEEIRLSSGGVVNNNRFPMKRDRKAQETVNMVCRGLSWYRNKVVDEVQSSHEVFLSTIIYIAKPPIFYHLFFFIVRGFDRFVRYARIHKHSIRSS